MGVVIVLTSRLIVAEYSHGTSKSINNSRGTIIINNTNDIISNKCSRPTVWSTSISTVLILLY